MDTILNEIVDNKRRELQLVKRDESIGELISRCEAFDYKHVSMRAALEQSQTGIIAEFKRASPSCGWINRDAKVEDVVAAYEQAGATACSVLTDNRYFGGALEDVVAARSVVSLPILRKEFVVDEYQIYQAYVSGANAVLLIASCLSEGECVALARLAKSLGLEVLLEVHNQQELELLNEYVDILGVNNRDLKRMVTDVNISFAMAEVMSSRSVQMKNPPLLISESGLKMASTIRELRSVGFRGFLMGESFMKMDAPADALAKLIGELR